MFERSGVRVLSDFALIDQVDIHCKTDISIHGLSCCNTSDLLAKRRSVAGSTHQVSKKVNIRRVSY